MTPSEAERLYHVPDWGGDFFFVTDDGHVGVRPVWQQETAIDLVQVTEAILARGVQLPALIRFHDILHARVTALNEAFRSAIDRHGYGGRYQGVYPIKVNQLREVVEEILEAGQPYDFGLECGSKSELVATLAYLDSDDTLLICNGYKDRMMMRLMIAGQVIGKNVIPVLERIEEYDLLEEEANRFERETEAAKGHFQFGARIRLSTAGAGLWAESGGENSKFGLSFTEMIRLIERTSEDERSNFRLIHFHLGSQIATLRNVRQAVEEVARVYVYMRNQGLAVDYVDIGGGLGVNYDAGGPTAIGDIDYTLEEYADAVVETMRAVCDEEGVPHPIIVSESGRAITAQHSVLVTEVIGARQKHLAEIGMPRADQHPLIEELGELLLDIDSIAEPELESLHQAFSLADLLRSRATELFRKGSLSLAQKAQAEHLFWSIGRSIHDLILSLGEPPLPAELQSLERQIVDQYLCDFSVFRSMVDHWAIGQRFPIMPLQRLTERPGRRGILVDLTCDSDGKVSDFVTPVGEKSYLELHTLRPDEPYLIGVFMMGAYQDIMGDMHNLFGRVTEAHIYADEAEPGNFYVEKIISGATVEEQLALVQYYPNDLERRMNRLIQEKVKSGLVRAREGIKLLDQYRQAFASYTYLEY
jgi:arginine decarboxylase